MLRYTFMLTRCIPCLSYTFTIFPLHPRALLLHFFHHYSCHDSVHLLHCQPFSPAPVTLANASTHAAHAHTHTHPVDEQASFFSGLSPFTNCTVVHFSTVPFCTDGGDLCADCGDLCKADNGKLTTARSRTPQLPPRFSEDSHAAKTVFFLPASLLKVKSSNLLPLTL